MNFFTSILSDDPDPPKSENSHDSKPNSTLKPHHDDRYQNDVAQDNTSNAWSFGSLIQAFATRSESVIEIYRRDLKEFGSGLVNEAEIIREAASRAVKDLPASLDGVLKSTADIISKETIVFASEGESETPETNRSFNSSRYSWFDSQLRAIQSDLNSFVEEPEDVVEYNIWKLEFDLDKMRDEIASLIGENGILQSFYKSIVPSAVDHETFWCRYFYRVDKLKQQERVRANLVKRAISIDDDEELSWDIEDDSSGSERSSDVKVKGGDGIGDKGVSNGNLKPFEKLEASNGESLEKEGSNLNMDDDERKCCSEK